MLITLTTDFGSPYVGIMKGVIKSIFKDVEIIEISSDVPPFDIKSGAFVLYSSYKFFPKGTIHIAIVDPGVGSERKAIAIRTRNFYFIGPDNGILIPAAKEDGIMEIREINIDRIPMPVEKPSSTFHGRDIFAPAAACLAKGIKFEEIGNIIDKYKNLEFFKIINGNIIECEVIFIDRFGNLILSIGEKDIFIERGVELEFQGSKYYLKNVRTYYDVNKGELMIVKGSSGFYEVSIREGSAKDLLNANVGSRIRIKVM
ncbi:MAG: SAM-dependent chlorinase/fluorinase [Candidatus Methanomethyliaceae archaeon]|nr:SAM-dependent chlorinase/fluorinase [Candidatus Methanomethyliaceae archaeon]